MLRRFYFVALSLLLGPVIGLLFSEYANASGLPLQAAPAR